MGRSARVVRSTNQFIRIATGLLADVRCPVEELRRDKTSPGCDENNDRGEKEEEISTVGVVRELLRGCTSMVK